MKYFLATEVTARMWGNFQCTAFHSHPHWCIKCQEILHESEICYYELVGHRSLNISWSTECGKLSVWSLGAPESFIILSHDCTKWFCTKVRFAITSWRGPDLLIFHEVIFADRSYSKDVREFAEWGRPDIIDVCPFLKYQWEKAKAFLSVFIATSSFGFLLIRPFSSIFDIPAFKKFIRVENIRCT